MVSKLDFWENNCKIDVLNYSFLADQKDRHSGVDAFRRGEKDVLVATDVASKGLDFDNIQHVINYDMPSDIENYGIFCGLLYY